MTYPKVGPCRLQLISVLPLKLMMGSSSKIYAIVRTHVNKCNYLPISNKFWKVLRAGIEPGASHRAPIHSNQLSYVFNFQDNQIFLDSFGNYLYIHDYITIYTVASAVCPQCRTCAFCLSPLYLQGAFCIRTVVTCTKSQSLSLAQWIGGFTITHTP